MGRTQDGITHGGGRLGGLQCVGGVLQRTRQAGIAQRGGVVGGGVHVRPSITTR